MIASSIELAEFEPKDAAEWDAAYENYVRLTADEA